MTDTHGKGPTTSQAALPSQGEQPTTPTRNGGAGDARDTEENIGMDMDGEAVVF